MNGPQTSMQQQIRFVDLAKQRARIGSSIDAAIADVMAHQQFIMGPEVAALERELESFCGATHAITCSSGTDALSLALMALGLKRGDAVVCPAFTFCATAEVVALLGAVPVFVDVDPYTYNINPVDVENTIVQAEAAGVHVAGVIAVDLFGRPADYNALEALISRRNLWLICDAAQSFGARYGERNVGSIGTITATSFFPAKPLGCYGDGGAVFTDDPALADLIRSLRIHGKGQHKYDNVRLGMTARLDTIQAAVLREKLKIFPDEIRARREVARRYNDLLSGCSGLTVPELGQGTVWAQYTLRVRDGSRDSLQRHLKEKAIPTQVYYPMPLHKQQAYAHYEIYSSGLHNSDALSETVISLPMHPYLDPDSIDYICSQISAFYKANV